MSEDELEPLVTECPSCGTRFRASESQLQKARGRVRCGACLTVFNGVHHLVLASDRDAANPEQAQQALDALLDELSARPLDVRRTDQPAEQLPEQPPEQPPELPADQPPVRLADNPLRPRPAIFAGFEEEPAAEGGDDPYAFQVLDESAAEEHEPAAQPAALEAPQQGGDTAVSPAPDQEPAAPRDPVRFGEPRLRRPLVWLGIAAGLVLLAGQVLWYQFDDWVEDPLWRAVYAPLCTVLGCQLPQQRDTSLLRTRNLAVRSDPQRPGVLQVNTVLVNEAEFAQPFPTLELRFTTLRGLLVAGRRFEPEDYLAGDAEGMELMPPRTPVQIELSIDDPGPDAVNYFLGFR